MPEPQPDEQSHSSRHRGQGRLTRLLVTHLKTPEQPDPDARLLSRHLPARRAALVGLLVIAVAALLAPLLLLTPLLPGSPASYRDDPAVQALEAWQSGLDGNPARTAAAADAARTLTVVTLADGSRRASRFGSHGRCFYLVVPADPAQPGSGIRHGDAADCS